MSDMNCTDFEKIVHDLDRWGTREMALRDLALAHAESCGICAQLMTETESLNFALQLLRSQDENEHASSRIETALLQEFRRSDAESSRPKLQRRMASLAFAATIFLAVGLGLHHQRFSSHQAVRSALADHAAASVTGITPVYEATSASQSGSSEYASAYVSLPYADDVSTLDGGAVVRVVISRAALEALGLPVADASNSDQIPADIVLSEDGTPEAVRLVAQSTD